MIKIVNNPFDIVIEATKQVFGDVDVLIQFNPEITDSCGYTVFPEEEGSTPLIDIAINIPFMAMVETLAHELAHIVTKGTAEEHGEEWEAAFTAIYEKYMELEEHWLEK